MKQTNSKLILTLSLLVTISRLFITFANNLDPDQARQNVRPDLDSKLVDTLTVFLKNSFEKLIFKKISRPQKKKTAKLASMQRVEEYQYHLGHGKCLYPCAAIKPCHAYIRYIHYCKQSKVGHLNQQVFAVEIGGICSFVCQFLLQFDKWEGKSHRKNVISQRILLYFFQKFIISCQFWQFPNYIRS